MDNSCGVFDYEQFEYEIEPSGDDQVGEASEIESCEISSVLNSEDVDDLRNFIKTYETMPEMWNPTNPNYINKTKRNIALDKLLIIYKKIKPTATRENVKRKINTLRSNYRKEFKKILLSKRSGTSADNVYKPTSYVFYALQFLDKFEQPVNTNVQEINETSKSNVMNNRERSPIRAICSASFASRSSILPIPQPPPARTQKNVGETAIRNEILQKACNFLDNSQEKQNNMLDICKAWSVKLNNLEETQRIYAENAINDLLFEATLGNLHKHSVSEKLNNLEKTQRIYAEKAINDIMFEATLGNLHRHSVQINIDNRNFRFMTPNNETSNMSTFENEKSSSQSISPVCEEQFVTINDFITNFKV